MFLAYLLVFSLAVVGMFTLVRLAFLELFKIKNNYFSNYLLLCINEKNCGDIAIETGIALSRLSWFGAKEYDGVIIADCGLSSEKREACKAVCERYGYELKKFKERSEKIEYNG